MCTLDAGHFYKYNNTLGYTFLRDMTKTITIKANSVYTFCRFVAQAITFTARRGLTIIVHSDLKLSKPQVRRDSVVGTDAIMSQTIENSTMILKSSVSVPNNFTIG